MNIEPEPTADLRLARTISAPRPDVFAAWTEPDQLRLWHRPAAVFTIPIVEVDLSVGGGYRIGMKAPDRDEPYTYGGEYREIEAPARLVFTSRWEPPDESAGESVVTIELDAVGELTELRLTQTGLPSAEAIESHRKGWNGTLDSLAAFFQGH
jgi:uncharacterized protein YndB with AHSA1/START domain